MWESSSDPSRCPLEPAIRPVYAGNGIPYGFKVDPWTITNPVVAIDGAIAAPFAARALVAWMVRARIGRGNVSPRRQRSDYPVPNDFCSSTHGC
jgi:hypothetical protein